MSGKGTVAKTAGGFILKYADDYLRIPRTFTKGAKSADEVARRIAKSGVDPNTFKKAKRLREKFLGKTPGKLSDTGQKVFKRMAEKGKIFDARGRPINPDNYPSGLTPRDLNKLRIRDANGTLRPLKQAHMGHNPVDAVDHWTTRGSRMSPQQNRDWMNDPANYEFEYGPDNMARGRTNSNRYRNAAPSHDTAEIP
ncbi:GH-E family nuclease [Enemella evansiae]|uniref:GH-E family nuclease n=1 Tax=Enemella evansiae TaxID=2016499 RepID=UPI00105FA8F0|nr:GH-E family nuclease [Enemella evansiae]TDO87652.1 HNH/ENDO VII superfamily nuclease [Enemella evansiae]